MGGPASLRCLSNFVLLLSFPLSWKLKPADFRKSSSTFMRDHHLHHRMKGQKSPKILKYQKLQPDTLEAMAMEALDIQTLLQEIFTTPAMEIVVMTPVVLAIVDITTLAINAS